jgi:hypothetical protein
VRRLLLTLAVTASAVVLLDAQRVTQDNLPAHVIVDSCSGCGGSSSGPIAIDQTTPGTTNGVAVTNTPHIVCDSGCGSPPATPDNAAFTASTTSVSITAGVYNDALAALSAGVSAAFRITASRALHVNLRDATGTEISPLTDAQIRATPLPVSGTVTTAPPANASANVVQWNGNTVALNSGVVGAGTLRIAPATDVTFRIGATSPTTGNTSSVNSRAVDPSATDNGLIVRNIPSGTQAISAASLPSHDVTNAGTFAVQAAQSGTWTVQPGNTANTTAWKVDGSAVTQPVSGTFWQATQPISGTVTVTDGAGALNVICDSGCAAGAPGQQTMAASSPVVIASDQSAVPVSLASVPSHAVTNAGTFAVQATLAAETTKVIGTVNIAAAQAVTANAGTNLNTSALALDATLTGRTQKAQITDGTRDGTVKAASTLPAATDTAARDDVA